MPLNQGTGSAFASGYQPPEKYDLALMAGIRLFVLMYGKRCPDMHSRPLMGPFDVVVAENFAQGSDRAAYNERWITGADAGIKYEPIDKKGTLIAFMPDDRFYHNRMILADQPALRLVEMQDQQNGIVSAAAIGMEIQCLRDVVNEQATIYKIMRNGLEIDYFWTEDEAIEFVNQEETVLRGNNRIPTVVTPFKKCKIVRGTKIRKRPNIVEMIRQHARDTYGWTGCQEFRETVLPKVNQLIKDRNRSNDFSDQGINIASPIDIKKQVIDIIRSLSDDEIKELRGKARSGSAGPMRDENTDPEPTTGLQNLDQRLLQKMKIEELQTICASMGIITTNEYKKMDYVKAIVGKQNEPASSGLSAMGTIEDFRSNDLPEPELIS
jgi:hypothetical protein